MDRDALEMRPDAAADWPDGIYDTLKAHGITQVALVPDAGHSALEPGVRTALVSAVERCRRRG